MARGSVQLPTFALGVRFLSFRHCGTLPLDAHKNLVNTGDCEIQLATESCSELQELLLACDPRVTQLCPDAVRVTLVARKAAPVEGVYEREAGSGSWYARYWQDGKKVRKAFGRERALSAPPAGPARWLVAALGEQSKPDLSPVGTLSPIDAGSGSTPSPAQDCSKWPTDGDTAIC